jgi:hypothetical protein
VVSIEIPSDVARRLSRRIFLIDAPDDLRLFWNDFEITRLPLDRAITVGFAACALAFRDFSCKAAPCLIRKVLKIKSAQHSSNADLNGVSPAAVHANEFHSAE